MYKCLFLVSKNKFQKLFANLSAENVSENKIPHIKVSTFNVDRTLTYTIRKQWSTNVNVVQSKQVSELK